MHRTVLIVPGFHGSGPDHWQSWMERRLPQARRVSGIDWEQPVLARWAEEVRREIDDAAGAVWVVAHSFGCLASVVAAADRPEKVAGLLLVAPADPERFSLLGPRERRPMRASVASALPSVPLLSPSLLVASRNDPWLSFPKAALLAEQWGSRLIDAGAAGHINVDSGHGEWPHGLALLADLQTLHDDLPLGPIDAHPCEAIKARKGRSGALSRLRHLTRCDLAIPASESA